jgi:hypothetical protein
MREKLAFDMPVQDEDGRHHISVRIAGCGRAAAPCRQQGCTEPGRPAVFNGSSRSIRATWVSCPVRKSSRNNAHLQQLLAVQTVELIFNEGPNDLFIIRVAGNSLGTEVLGSLKFAVEHLSDNLKLIVVLGHSGCGALTTAVDVFLNPADYLALAGKHSLRYLMPCSSSCRPARRKFMQHSDQVFCVIRATDRR